MNDFINGIDVSGLADDINSAMMQNAQKKIIDEIMNAARNGRTDCEIHSKGTTPVFLAQLEEEGVYNIPKESSVTLFWEF